MKTVVSITGIRPDFIRMSKVFAELDKHVNHILIHTGQHYDNELSGVFFEQLGIRKPDFILEAGKKSTNHLEQLSYLTCEIPKLFRDNHIQPDLIVFLGDSNSAGVSFPLKKEGYQIAHIEAGMRSYDKRMLEEINRTVCDHCSDLLFVYHEDYKEQLVKEGITKNVFVVGNTIVEPFQVVKDQIMVEPKHKDLILLDCHRPENFNRERLYNIITFANECAVRYQLPVKLLYFKRLLDKLNEYQISLGKVEMVPLMPYQEYLKTVYHSRFIISDSGTGQEEPALLQTRVVVPRDFTERPQSYQYGCSIKLNVNQLNSKDVFDWLDGSVSIDSSWLGDGQTSKKIIEHIMDFLT
jgi:UDP-N-acetylglucosamine 2-epimerase (non-hydrolysing)